MNRYCVLLVFLAAVGCAASEPTIAERVTERITELGDSSDEVRLAARLDLAAEGKEVEPYLLQALHHANSRVRYGSSAVLRSRVSELGPEALPDLEAAAVDDNRCVRDNALQMIGSLGPQARSALPTISRALQDPDPHVSRSAVLALGKVQQQEAIPELIALLQDPSLKYTAALALERLGPSASTAVPALEVMAADEDASTRKAARDALHVIRGDAKARETSIALEPMHTVRTSE